MKIPYITNPFLPKVRAQAVDMHRQGHSVREVARHFGVVPSTISKWNKRIPDDGAYLLETRSSRPKSHPNAISPDIVKRIVKLRKKTNGRCAEVIHQMLINEGFEVSLSTVKRTLERKKLTKKRSPYRKYHRSIKRPFVCNPGDLVQIDTVHIMKNKKQRIYIYTLLDVYSRWAYAKASKKINSMLTVEFVKKAHLSAPFEFICLQTDHGPEFRGHFTERIGILHRHSRVRMPNDNAHLERFNRTIQEECINALPKNVDAINEMLPNYLKYYNYERLHHGLALKTPSDFF